MKPRTIRTALAVAAAGTAAFAGLQQLGAQAFSGHDSNAPVNYAADRIELQDKQKRVVLAGNVDITQGDLRLRAARTTVAYTDGGSLKIQRMDATGGVFVRSGAVAVRLRGVAVSLWLPAVLLLRVPPLASPASACAVLPRGAGVAFSGGALSVSAAAVPVLLRLSLVFVAAVMGTPLSTRRRVTAH